MTLLLHTLRLREEESSDGEDEDEEDENEGDEDEENDGWRKRWMKMFFPLVRSCTEF